VPEYNFDGLVGPTHNYGGLSPGNVASLGHEGQLSNPRRAALQGLEKMRFVASLGAGQAVLPPQPRPSLRTLRELGFTGSDEEVLAEVAKAHDHILRLCSSASAMWAANAATVAPSEDTADRRVHLTPANLQAMFHRSIEADTTHAVLRAIFADESHFAVHAPLPGGGQLADEGAANHTRLHTSAQALHLFAWGRRALGGEARAPQRFPARQTLEASQAVARRHRLHPSAVVFAQQHPDGIDAGAFHTDVVAVGSGRTLLMHELAFLDPESVMGALRTALGEELRVVMATEKELPVADAVASYPFNSQLLDLPDGRTVMVAPEESREMVTARRFLERAVAEGAIGAVFYLDVRESMNNGGGPACLRQRIVLTEEERAAVAARVFLDEELAGELASWIERHYRDRLLPADLADPALARESLTALDELTRILRLGSVYDFQQ
jgi:succinylarginine dihydrolase